MMPSPRTIVLGCFSTVPTPVGKIREFTLAVTAVKLIKLDRFSLQEQGTSERAKLTWVVVQS